MSGEIDLLYKSTNSKYQINVFGYYYVNRRLVWY